jgi:hypothetical protein
MVRVGAVRLRDIEGSRLPTEHTKMSQGNKDAVEQSELDLYGIETVPANVFLWGSYRYSNARDAVAAAKRSAKP